MSRTAITNIANDNDPHTRRPQGDSVGFRSMLREQELERRLQALELEQLMHGAQSMSNPSQEMPQARKWGVILALLCTLVTTLVAAYCFYSGQSAVITVIALVALVWSALWTTYLSSERKDGSGEDIAKPRLTSEFSIIIATIAGLAVWVIASREWGLALSASDGVAGFAALTAITAALLQSRLTLLMSALAGLAWLALYTQVPSINIFSIWLYPPLAIIQLFIAGHNDVKFPAALTLIGAYFWLFWIFNNNYMAGNISLLHVAAFSALIGLAHYRLGKAAGDAMWESANLHVVSGWALAMAGIIGLQHYWLGTETPLWENTSAAPLGELSWQIIGGVCITLVGISGLIRMAHKQMSSLAVICSLAVILTVAAVFDQREAIDALIQSELNMSSMPFIGILIGAAVFASAIAMCINSARRKSLIMMFAGLAVVAIQMALLLDPSLWSPEIALTFGMGLAISFAFAALFAASTSADYA